ncbi:hypothetical protein EDD15DRAFT_894576 [Pisolithus albus]|nr:hypothetical protein EDD15DRAFT_894576 [Pisolithus albus]
MSGDRLECNHERSSAPRRMQECRVQRDISSDSTKVVAGCFHFHGSIRLFDIRTGTQLLPPISHPCVAGVKFSPNGSHFAAASDDCGVRVYSTHDGKSLLWPGHPMASNCS